jgi:hypothetical protein
MRIPHADLMQRRAYAEACTLVHIRSYRWTATPTARVADAGDTCRLAATACSHGGAAQARIAASDRSSGLRSAR